ncbi:MAG: cytochrome C [Bacteroidetes bacterium]|nr:MAG: cytochrome C [Bacteroidota bacterium]PTM10072.1 MAG: cytochrome C [Bacteroidota bacterium]
MRSTIVLFAFTALLVYACGGSGTPGKDKPFTTNARVDDGKGVGGVTEVALSTPLDQAMVAAGKSMYELKCAACHRLTDMRVVGPGWAGVTQRRKPEWIMNMTMNVEVMLEKDPAAQKMLEECLVRMPNQGLTLAEARSVLEFMRMNDGEQ